MVEPIPPLVPPGVFEPAGHYFDTPTYGLAPVEAFEAVIDAARRWRAGTATMAEYDGAVFRSRELFAQIVGMSPARVAIGANVSSLVGPVATGLPAGSTVLIPEGEFTSLLFPLLVNAELEVRTVPLDELALSINDSVDVVAFSLVQSSNGAVADIEAIGDAARHHSAVTLVDATHAVGWFPFDPKRFDFVFAAAYKWLLCPRGVAFMVVNSELPIPSVNAGWYAGEDPWASIYGGPLRLAESARRFDTSPAWIAWMGAVPSLELIASLGVDRIHAHDTALANMTRTALGLAPSTSAMVILPTDNPRDLAEAGIKASVRDAAVRIGCHIHNSSRDVEALVAALSDHTSR